MGTFAEEKMKIVFHIPRMNWYRVLSSIIDEALRRGHDVECWHNSAAKQLGENCPNHEKIPNFRFGSPIIIDYKKPENVVKLIEQRLPEVVIDLHPPRFSNFQRIKDKNNGLPFWLIVDLPPSDSFLEIQSDEELFGCDGFAICNENYLNASISYGKQDKLKLLSSVNEQAKKIGYNPGKWIAERFLFQFSETHEKYIRERSVVVGNAGYDGYSYIDREVVRKRFKINESKKIIVLLPFPFIYDHTAPWEQIFVGNTVLHRLYWIFKQNRYDYLSKALTWPSNLGVVKALRRFADKNDAILVAKLRHSRMPGGELKKYCHLLVGEEGYYPHTAAELFSIANLVVGYYSTASTEAVALNVPYLNIDVQEFPKKFNCDTRKPLFNCDPFPGVIYSLDASKAIVELPNNFLDNFSINPDMRKNYLRKFANWPLGGGSEKILNYIENNVRLKSKYES